jgi:hypothetical protein
MELKCGYCEEAISSEFAFEAMTLMANHLWKLHRDKYEDAGAEDLQDFMNYVLFVLRRTK